MPICVSLGPFNWINLEIDIWQDTAHPATQDRSPECWAVAAQLSSCPPDTAQLCWQLHACWTHHPCSLPGLKLSPTEFTAMSCCPHQHYQDFSLQLSRAAFCMSDGLLPLFVSPGSQCLLLRCLKLNFLLCVFLKLFIWIAAGSCSPARLGRWLCSLWDCSLFSTGWETPGPVQFLPRNRLFQLPLLSCSISAHNFFHVPGHSLLTNMQHYEN